MEFKSEIEARGYLSETDFYFTVDKYAQLTQDKKTELELNRELARKFIRALTDK